MEDEAGQKELTIKKKKKKTFPFWLENIDTDGISFSNKIFS